MSIIQRSSEQEAELAQVYEVLQRLASDPNDKAALQFAAYLLARYKVRLSQERGRARRAVERLLG